jgi:hypothetical protein
MAKTLTMRLDDETYQTFVRAAKAERRSLANLVETAALRGILENSFVHDAEMAEIASRPELVKRLQRGSRDARKRHGRFIPPV